jgi:hypothetical protein
MATLRGVSAETLANHFVNYLFDEYKGSRHVRRVASWVGLIVLGIEKLQNPDWKVPRKRQMQFTYQGKSYKAKYAHDAGPRGGIRIIEVLPGPGSPEGKTIASIANLKEAEDFYNSPKTLF